MLCLFLDAMPKTGILILGIGKSFKINNLRLIWGCCAHDSQNLKKGGGDQILEFFLDCKRAATNKQKSRYLQKVSVKFAKGSRESWAQLLLFIYYLYLQILLPTCQPLRPLTLAYIPHAFLYAEIPAHFLDVTKCWGFVHFQKKAQQQSVTMRKPFKIKDLQKKWRAFF